MGFLSTLYNYTIKPVITYISTGIRCFYKLTMLKKFFVSALAFTVLVVVWAAIGTLSRLYEFRDKDPMRGAMVVEKDLFGDEFTSTVYLDQGWDAADSLWFYNLTQGSNLLPYDFFLVLEQQDSQELFRDTNNVLRYRYLPQHASVSNPDALPVGMTLDTYQGKRYMGFTCAACHSTQLNYNKVGIRIDGGPAMADMENFMVDLAAAVRITISDKDKRARFIKAVLERGDYSDEQQVLADLDRFSYQLTSYAEINSPHGDGRPLTTYGYARLDAFGRIFNRVLEHLMSAERLRDVLARSLDDSRYDEVMEKVEPILSADNRDDLLAKVQNAAEFSPQELLQIRKEMFNPADAPVSYPFLWDIPQHDYVQWNGVVSNANIGPMGRNAGQVIGVFGTLDWQQQQGVTLSSILGGQGLFADSHIKFDSSINIRNLRRVETHLRKLTSPLWPQDIIKDKLDQKLARKGKRIFDRYCEACHERIDSRSPQRRVIAMMSKVPVIKTDAKMAANSVAYTGYSGIIEKQYVRADLGNVFLERRAPTTALLTMSTANVVTTPDPDKIFIQRWAERLFDFAFTFFDSEVQPSLKRGDYDIDTSMSPFASLLAYKARSLNGIWATAPYLHNGSVPSLYHLLLPKKRAGDPDDGEYRPDEFVVGSREFDADKVGLKWQGYDGFVYRTDVDGNSNAGHEYGAGRSAQPDGTVLPALDKQQRSALLEYLKTL